jgi:dipeptidyl aminopeptidase/acylaminoacyl peptidase
MLMSPRVVSQAATRGLAVVTVCVSLFGALSADPDSLTPDDVARLRNVSSARISPDGKLVAFVRVVPRVPCEDEDGPAWTELHVAGPRGRVRPFVTGEVQVSAIDWTPDGSGISFLAERGKDEHAAVYVIPVDGGEARQVVSHERSITAYSFSPDGSRIAFLAKAEQDETEAKLEKKGFKAEVYEEQQQPVLVWIATPNDLDGEDGDDSEPRALDLAGSASELHWSPAGNRLAVALAPTSLIDDHYMRRKVHIVDAETGEVVVKLDNPGKLGAVRWSPDGERLALVSSEDLNDPLAGRLMVADLEGRLRDLVPAFAGHVTSIEWHDSDTIIYVADEGVLTSLARVDVDGSGAATLVAPGGPILGGLTVSRDGRTRAMVADSPEHPSEVFVMGMGDDAPTRWTDSNPWLSEMRLAPHEIVTYKARDGLEIEGILMRPLDYEPDSSYPLVLIVHGGPEGHYSNGWITRYSSPGQVLAASGFAVFYPNYRGSTGRGVEFTKLDQADYAGGEFNDLVDGVEHLVNTGLVDRDKVGVTGGSYGGFATAWCSTALTEHFAAGVMFIGISDQISKAGTTDISNEMFEVHSRRWPWEHWDWFRERSPIYYVEQARTPILILHGKEDTRVHPGQSMELYRYLKLVDKTPVRLVLYPGEGHGNRRASARLDYTLRLMRWMEHYLVGPGGEPPEHAVPEELACVQDDDENDDESP